MIDVAYAAGGKTASEVLEKIPRDKFECVIVVG